MKRLGKHYESQRWYSAHFLNPKSHKRTIVVSLYDVVIQIFLNFQQTWKQWLFWGSFIVSWCLNYTRKGLTRFGFTLFSRHVLFFKLYSFLVSQQKRYNVKFLVGSCIEYIGNRCISCRWRWLATIYVWKLLKFSI